MNRLLGSVVLLFAAISTANAYWLMGIEDFITTERIDPIVSPGKVASHVHSVLGGSNFRFNTSTAQLRESECTSIPIPQDKSNYWFPHLYFQWKNGSFTSLNGGAVIYYLFSDTPGTTTAFPDDFRMITGDPTLRSYNASSFAQQAVTFLCLDFSGTSTKWNMLPPMECPSGIRAQINFPSCWDGKNVDSPDHKSHVSYLSTGPDSGTCSDPKFPVTLPRIFMEVYWGSNDFDQFRSQAMNSTQPFVYSMGDPTGFGYHADFMNGWEAGVLQRAVNECHCNEFGDATCCAQQGIFDINQGQNCYITKSVDEQTTGTIPKLPGNNPVVGWNQQVVTTPPSVTPAILSPVKVYESGTPPAEGSVVIPAQTNTAGATSATIPSSVDAPTGGSSSGSTGSSGTGSGSTSSGGSSSSSGSSSPASGSNSGSSGSSGSTGSSGSSTPASGSNSGSSGSGGSTGSSSPASGSNSGSSGSGGSTGSSGSSSTTTGSTSGSGSGSSSSGSSPASSGSGSGSSSSGGSSSGSSQLATSGNSSSEPANNGHCGARKRTSKKKSKNVKKGKKFHSHMATREKLSRAHF